MKLTLFSTTGLFEHNHALFFMFNHLFTFSCYTLPLSFWYNIKIHTFGHVWNTNLSRLYQLALVSCTTYVFLPIGNLQQFTLVHKGNWFYVDPVLCNHQMTSFVPMLRYMAKVHPDFHRHFTFWTKCWDQVLVSWTKFLDRHW